MFDNTINAKFDLCHNFFYNIEGFAYSSVKTDWNHSLNALAFAQSDVAGNPEHGLRVGMSVSSLCKALIYGQKDLGLSF